jgi:hypothetical protein
MLACTGKSTSIHQCLESLYFCGPTNYCLCHAYTFPFYLLGFLFQLKLLPKQIVTLKKGDTLYRSKSYIEAIQAYKTSSDSARFPTLQKFAYYNIARSYALRYFLTFPVYQ